jgi:hypothetical protein
MIFTASNIGTIGDLLGCLGHLAIHTTLADSCSRKLKKIGWLEYQSDFAKPKVTGSGPVGTAIAIWLLLKINCRSLAYARPITRRPLFMFLEN